MRYSSHRRTQGGVSLTTILLVLLVVIGVVFIGWTWRRWEWTPPAVTFDRDFKALGRQPSFTIHVEDAGNALARVQIVLQQNGQDVVLIDDLLENSEERTRSYDAGKLISEKHKAVDGQASLKVVAADSSFGNFFRGNSAETTRAFVFDTQPPSLEVMSGQHYINQGGAECVVYRVSDDADQSGVRVGPHFFPGYPLAGGSGLRFAVFAFAYDLPVDTIAQVVARDAAGNESVAGFWQKVFPKPFRIRDIAVDDAFLKKVLPEILSRTPAIQDQGDLIKTFVEVNGTLRRQNHAAIAALSASSPPQFLWSGSFLQLSNSQVESLFADRRTYLYNGQAVDKQDHVGFDLSVVERYPIEAANDGKVVLAEYFGIYGNTVLVDHGAGLISLYGHMSSIDVKPGDTVKKKQALGRSGATGLAGGDHLHFGMFLHGVPVNPTEWWDEKWVREHVLNRLKSGTD
jgi:murein DD-endopeptidase MepM/ murein hydrolase activator NlpD